ncbi:hypothetical protein ACIOG8_02360 [Streptomyces erythrochromogenes]|uniref:hypothetical protein n=1 Tax=Streptomyces erythrochromogenes TaxID=285574 RepID=UPI0037FAD0A5
MNLSREPLNDTPVESWLTCAVCNNGIRTFMVRTGTGRLHVECDECLSGFTGIAGAGLDGHFWTDQTTWEARPACRSEVLAAGLAWSIKGEGEAW